MWVKGGARGTRNAGGSTVVTNINRSKYADYLGAQVPPDLSGN